MRAPLTPPWHLRRLHARRYTAGINITGQARSVQGHRGVEIGTIVPPQAAGVVRASPERRVPSAFPVPPLVALPRARTAGWYKCECKRS